METDSQLAIRVINSSDFDDVAARHLVEEIKSLASILFLSFVCQFEGRLCNQVAHELAMLGQMCVEGEEQIISYFPESISVIIANELSNKIPQFQKKKVSLRSTPASSQIYVLILFQYVTLS